MIKIDINKAKEIGHNIRRKVREEEFAPLDKKAMIPVFAEAAEAERQAVREKYAEMQAAIDSAETPDEIKDALGIA